nr:DUF2663 family protein [Paenibacillus bovis]
MEPFLLNIDDHSTKYMLQNLINKKLKFIRYKNIHFIFLTSAFLYSFFAFYFIYKTGIEPYDISMMDAFSSFLRNSHFATLICIAFILFGAVKIFNEKKEKLEKEFHALRCEIIDKANDVWKGESKHERNSIYEKMKKKYDINLYHVSK